MLGVDWTSATIGVSFFVGVVTGILLSVRLVKVLAEFLRKERDR